MTRDEFEAELRREGYEHTEGDSVRYVAGRRQAAR